MDDVIRVYGASWCRTAERPSASSATSGSRSSGTTSSRPRRRPNGAGAQRQRQHHPDDHLPGRLHLSEPSNEELAEKIGLERMAMMHVYDLIIVGGGPAKAHDLDLLGPREPADAGDRQQGPRRPGGRDRTSRQLPRSSPRASAARNSPTGSCNERSVTAWRCSEYLGAFDLERRQEVGNRDRDTATITTPARRSSRPARRTG